MEEKDKERSSDAARRKRLPRPSRFPLGSESGISAARGSIRPLRTALRASRPAPIITDGLLVFVHEVMAAMTTAPCVISSALPL